MHFYRKHQSANEVPTVLKQLVDSLSTETTRGGAALKLNFPVAVLSSIGLHEAVRAAVLVVIQSELS